MTEDVAVMLRRYGFVGVDRDGRSGSKRFGADAGISLLVVGANDSVPGLSMQPERAGQCLFEPRRWSVLPKRRAYRALLDHVSFTASGLTPIWTAASGRPVVGWWTRGSQRTLVVGLDLVEELVRYTHGDPAKVETAKDKTLWGLGDHERAAYLFEDNIVRGFEMVPWADRLGFLIARALSQATQLPLLSPLPNGATGAVLLTGDDDQAELEKYATQLRLLDGFPITYLMLPHTRHTRASLAGMPATVEFGVHVDALEDQARYAEICVSQTEAVRDLVGAPVRTVRNHGHLNQGYWTQLEAWERSGLTLDFNIRGLDGTCPTGSYLPFRVRRPDRSWSGHWSLFSTFSDGMLFMQKWPESKQIQVIRALADSITATFPGIIVANFHPQNVDSIPEVHRAVKSIAAAPRWTALGAESYAQWLEVVDGISLIEDGEMLGLVSASSRSIDGVAMQWPDRTEPSPVPTWTGRADLARPAGTA